MAKKTAQPRRPAPTAARSKKKVAEVKLPALAPPGTPAAPPTTLAPTRETRAVAARTGPVKVKATMLGYYDDIRRRDGDVFFIRSMKDFSERWMVLAHPREQERITTGLEDLRKKHDEILRDRMPGGHAPMMTDSEPDAGNNPLGA